MSAPASNLTNSFSPTPLPTFGGYIAAPGVLSGVSFWPRAIARIIDMALHFAVSYSAGYLFGRMVVLASGGHVSRLIVLKLRHPGFIGFACGILGVIAYHVIFTTVHGSSVGKRLLSIVVMDEEGEPCRLKGAIVRELGYFVDALFFGLIGYMAMHGSTQEQRYGDEWGHTVVCERSAISPDKLQDAGRFVVALMFATMADAAIIMIGLLIIIAG
jgi:uncharacterized RDD family membrane protein YckC